MATAPLIFADSFQGYHERTSPRTAERSSGARVRRFVARMGRVCATLTLN